MIRLKNRISASTEGIHSGSNSTNTYGMEESEGSSQSAEMNETSGSSWAMQTKILFLKTWKCKFRAGKNKLLEEILTPVLFLLALAVFSWTLRKTRETYPSETEEFNAQDILNSQISSYQIHVVHGNESYAKGIMADMNSVWKSQQPSPLNFTWISNEQDLKNQFNRDPESIVLAVILPETRNSSTYSIRANPDYYNTKLLPSPSTDVVGLETCRVHLHPEVLDDPSTCPVNGYFYSSFLSLQFLVDQALIMSQMKGKRALNIGHPKITMQNYPKPSYNPGLPITLRILIPLYLTMSFLPFVGNLMVLIVTEKENKIKDGLRMIGVSEVAYWVSCFAAYAVIMILVSLLCTIVIAWIIIQDTERILIFLLTLLFGLSLITFAFAMTPFFHKPKTAASAAAYVLTLSTLLFLLQTFFKDSSQGFLVPLRLISTVAFTTAIDEACAYEFFGGIEWKDLTPNGKGSGILLSLLFLIFDIVLYGMIAMYLDNVIPNEYGVKKHPLFCFARSYWQECCLQQQSQSCDNILSGSVVDNEDVENVDNSLRRRNVIKIRNISKAFGSWSSQETVHALTEISMDIYEGQITSVLGRNGAGKSTLINILTGFLTPTSGQCVLFGLDLANPHDMARLRRMSGVCMQQDLHFEKLTVQEHLEFYGKLRGVESSSLLVEIEGLLHELQLTEQKNVASEKLSGGQRRKLSVGIALIGSPKFILLDEPSAGVDPVSRRHIWSLLQSKKEGRVILLTTHFMDEADILADRKAIIHEGTLKCMGSSLFLKTKFGIGYYLTVELDERNPDVKRSNEIVAAFIPEAVASAQVIGNEAKYGLSHSKVDKFAAMFRAFETEIDSSSAIASFGVSLTTLEEVFLKISSEDETTSAAAAIMPHRRRDSVNSTQSDFDGLPSVNPNPIGQVAREDQLSNLIPNAGKISPSSTQILMAMCGLRLKRLTRNYMSFILLIIMPVVSLTAGFLVLKYSGGVVVEKVTFSVAPESSVYPESSLNLALSRESTDNFTKFFQGLKGVKTYSYSGVYQDLLQLGDTDKGTLASVSVETGNSFRMRINGTFLHAPALVMNLFSVFYLRQLMLEEGVTTAVPPSTVYHPFPSKTSQSLEIAKSLNSLLLLGTVFIYVSGALIMEIVKDREIKARTHLRVNGVSFNLYFLPMLSLFCGLAVCHVIMQVVIVYAFSVEAFTNIYAVVTMVALLLVCIFPSLLFTAAFSYLFNKMDTAQRVFFNFSIIAGYFCMLLRLGLETKYPDQSLLMVIVLCSLNVFYTPYAIFNLIFKEFVVCSYLGTCDQLSFKNYWGNETQAIFIIMLLQIPLFYALLVLADFMKNGGHIRDLPVLKSFLHRRSPGNLISHGLDEAEEEDDVRDEKSRVSRFLSSSQEAATVVAVQDLRKTYQVKKPRLNVTGNKSKLKEVLRGISFLVEEGEVFGLLGHNGAGKTTCIKMMIAEEFPDDGNVWLCGHDVKSNYSPAFMQLGYCPQHDALWDNITLQEHIELYMTIRGVDKNNRSRLVEHFLKGLQIEEHAKKQAKKLSGGTKRKLSYCMSVLGSPKIVLLDEPSTGMDVTSKRFLWNTIIATFKDKRGAILTTHAMEEADALCTRIAIMVRGALVCIGSPQHLKSKYGVGYTLEVKIRAGSPVSPLHIALNDNDGDEMPVDPDKFSFIKDRFPSAILSEQFGDRAIYSIPKLDLKISDAFETLESLKQTSNIEEYSFSQTTLEQVFIQFSKENEEMQY